MLSPEDGKGLDDESRGPLLGGYREVQAPNRASDMVTPTTSREVVAWSSLEPIIIPKNKREKVKQKVTKLDVDPG